ncbi:hypothetical protein ACBI99_44640 [Nonomuraea sp. ATR24]|uniref:hypothetical protein n=1 Tax=Nonomuraea sp. ATR24 TaxID=1676744 RepID=UPI0035C18681
MTDHTPADLHLALAKLSEITAVGIADIKGQLALLVQRADHAERRVDELAARISEISSASEARYAALETRLDTLDREAVTRPQLAERSRQIIGIVSVVVAILALIATVVIALIK